DETVLGRSLYFDAFQKFEDCTKKGEAPRIVVFVDDLDRCLPKNALELLEHIKLVLSQKGFTFILGVNEKAIQKAIETKAKRTKDFPEDYLDKLIQVTIRVPKRQPDKMEEYIGGLLDDGKIFPEEQRDDLIVLIADATDRNPRSVVRLLNRIILLYRIGKKEGSAPEILHLLIHAATDEERFHEFCNALKYSLALPGGESPTIGEYLADLLEKNNYDTFLQESQKPELDVGVHKTRLEIAVSAFRNSEPLFNLLKSDAGLVWLRDPDLRESLRDMADTTVGESKTEEKREEEIMKKRSSKTEDPIRQLESQMVPIKGGTFMMGDSEDSGSSSPHEVHVDDFEIAAMPVTQALYKAVIGPNPAHFEGLDHPVESVSWNDAVRFCEKLSELTRKKYALPTEAQWEYACRAGSTTRFCFGDDEKDLDNYAWYSANSEGATHPVGLKKPNDWGLYDMHGNVWEWCEDDWHQDYRNAPSDGSAWIDSPRGSSRVVRGGGWDDDAGDCRSAHRSGAPPDTTLNPIGFRIVLVSSRTP
ncbi:MAG: SUMF1/EgtB/PvdO family nonheme iron enzyme, partial [bacterium]